MCINLTGMKYTGTQKKGNRKYEKHKKMYIL